MTSRTQRTEARSIPHQAPTEIRPAMEATYAEMTWSKSEGPPTPLETLGSLPYEGDRILSLWAEPAGIAKIPDWRPGSPDRLLPADEAEAAPWPEDADKVATIRAGDLA